ncbi:MAG: hypothetical protein PHI66_02440 [Candidatus Pacebacteria bacterium]|nr:hypothetical protein [Candidatus Paceibacterota bacterium]
MFETEAGIPAFLKIAPSLIAFAIIWALFEIETEGTISWAALFPCARYKKSPETKEITSYHILLGLMLFMAFEITSIAVFGIWIPIEKLVQLGAWMLLVTNLEDYLWNIMNPSELYGWKETFVERRYPTARFIWNIPVDYFMMTGGSLLFAVISGINLYLWLSVLIALIMVAVALTISMPAVHGRFPEWKRRYQEHNRRHCFFLGDDVVATIQVDFSDGRSGYTTEVPGVSTTGRIKHR